MYHKIINKQGEIIGISANDEEISKDENWIEISEEEYQEIEKTLENKDI